MTEHYPTVTRSDGLLVVVLASLESSTEARVNSVLDVTAFGDVIGVEILDLRRLTGGFEPAQPSGDAVVRWAYDEEIDAFYLHVSSERASTQRSATCRVHLDVDHHMVALTIDLGSAGQ